MFGACDEAAASERRPFFSIIMPCYGVAAYLPDAIACVRAQTCADWELICVDDASPDNVARIVEAAAAQDARIRLVRHKENQGLSGARNTGIAAARGSYVWMPDPDDTYDPELLEECRAAIAMGAGVPMGGVVDPASFPLRPNTSCDVVVFGCREEYRADNGAVTGTRELVPALDGAIFNTDDLDAPTCHVVAADSPAAIELAAGRSAFLLNRDEYRSSILDLEELTLFGYAWNKVYRREVLDGLSFEDVPLIEDVCFNIEVARRVGSAAVICRPLYRYQKRENVNLTNKFVPRYYEVHRRRVAELFELLRGWGLDSTDARSRLGFRFARYVLSAIERTFDERAGMDAAARRAFCAELTADPLYRELIVEAPARSGRVSRALHALLARGNPHLMLAAGRCVHEVRGRCSRAYASAKTVG